MYGTSSRSKGRFGGSLCEENIYEASQVLEQMIDHLCEHLHRCWWSIYFLWRFTLLLHYFLVDVEAF